MRSLPQNELKLEKQTNIPYPPLGTCACMGFRPLKNSGGPVKFYLQGWGNDELYTSWMFYDGAVIDLLFIRLGGSTQFRESVIHPFTYSLNGVLFICFMRVCMCAEVRTTFRHQFSPSTIRVPGINLNLPELRASTLPIDPPHQPLFILELKDFILYLWPFSDSFLQHTDCIIFLIVLFSLKR